MVTQHSLHKSKLFFLILAQNLISEKLKFLKTPTPLNTHTQTHIKRICERMLIGLTTNVPKYTNINIYKSSQAAEVDSPLLKLTADAQGALTCSILCHKQIWDHPLFAWQWSQTCRLLLQTGISFDPLMRSAAGCATASDLKQTKLASTDLLLESAYASLAQQRQLRPHGWKILGTISATTTGRNVFNTVPHHLLVVVPFLVVINDATSNKHYVCPADLITNGEKK